MVHLGTWFRTLVCALCTICGGREPTLEDRRNVHLTVKIPPKNYGTIGR